MEAQAEGTIRAQANVEAIAEGVLAPLGEMMQLIDHK